MYNKYKEKVNLNDMNALVDLRREMQSKLEWAEENLESKEFNNILDLYDFITEKIAEYYIEKYH